MKKTVQCRWGILLGLTLKITETSLVKLQTICYKSWWCDRTLNFKIKTTETQNRINWYMRPGMNRVGYIEYPPPMLRLEYNIEMNISLHYLNIFKVCHLPTMQQEGSQLNTVHSPSWWWFWHRWMINELHRRQLEQQWHKAATKKANTKRPHTQNRRFWTLVSKIFSKFFANPLY